MGVKFTNTNLYKYPSTAGGDVAFWEDCAISILTELYELGLPIRIDTLQSLASNNSDGSFSAQAIAVFEGEEDPKEDGSRGSFIDISFSYNGSAISSYIMIGGGWNESFMILYPLFRGKNYTLSDSYNFSISSCKVGNSFVFRLLGYDPIIITPMRSLSNPSEYYGYGAVSAVQLQPTRDPTWNGTPSTVYYKTIPYLEDYDYSLVNWPPMPIYTQSLDISTLPDKDSGKIITIPIFSGVADIYYQDVYLTNLNHSKSFAKVFETDQGALLVIQQDLTEVAEYHSDLELYTSWEQYPVAQIALDISSTYNA